MVCNNTHGLGGLFVGFVFKATLVFHILNNGSENVNLVYIVGSV